MKKKIIFSMSCIALLSILLSMVLSGVVSYYDSLEIVKKSIRTARCDLTVLQMPQTWKTTTTARRSLLQEKTVRGNPCVNPIR